MRVTMRDRIVHLVLVLGVILGLLLPKTSAALADLGVIDAGAVLICTGHGIERVHLDGDHGPAPAETGHDPVCLLVHSPDGFDAPPLPAWIALAPQRVQPVARPQVAYLSPVLPGARSRAPPRA